MDMRDHEETDTADPDEPRPAGPLFVPVRLGSAGGFHLRFLRTPLGVRTAVAFTCPERLTETLGERQRWIRLAEPALRALAEPLGVTTLTVDPRFAAPSPVVRAVRAPLRICVRGGGDPDAMDASLGTAARAFPG
ncbi:SAV_915 family protein [Streptomyces jumonjinensis]